MTFAYVGAFLDPAANALAPPLVVSSATAIEAKPSGCLMIVIGSSLPP